MDTGTDIIVAEGLVKRYGARTVVRDVSFRVRAGELFGFLGPNGAGKTTTINILSTLTDPSAGTATVAGFDVTRQQADVRRSIGLVFQEPALDEYLTAAQNLRFHAMAYGVPRREAAERTRELLDLVALWDRRSDKVRSFSGGMRRRLELVRGLLHRPRVLFLDEPTLGLDPRSRRQVWQYLDALRAQEDLTIFLTTHYMDEADGCDRIALIDDGVIVAQDTPDNLKRAVGGDVITIHVPDAASAARELASRYGLDPLVDGDAIRFSVDRGDRFLPDFIREFPQRLEAVSLRRPTLDDVFLQLTGHEIAETDAVPAGVER